MKNKTKIAFVVGSFPAVSETWLINQVAELIDRGAEVEIFSLRRIQTQNISQKFYDYDMASRTHYLNMPESKVVRFFLAIPKILHLLLVQPSALWRALNFKKYGHLALSLRVLFWTEPFVSKKFDLFHCHFGTIANEFLLIREVLSIQTKFITSFYGYDASKIFQDYPGEDIYKDLKKACSAFIAMSDVMKSRMIEHGFDGDKITVLPIFGIDVEAYPFRERSLQADETVQIVTIGRFVEKKGFDDLLRAIAIVKDKAKQKFVCNIIGGGRLEQQLRALTEKLNLADSVSFKGYMKIEDIINYLQEMHFYLQPSKTAPDGDME